MIFHEIGPNRYRVQRDKDDEMFHGTVEKHAFVSIEGGKRVPRQFWMARGAGGGWRADNKTRFATRREAGECLLQESSAKYADKRMDWKKR
jgi:hypothetical protein